VSLRCYLTISACSGRDMRERDFYGFLGVRTVAGRDVGEGFPEQALLNASRCGERRTVHPIRQFHRGSRSTGQRLEP
jgi:hypothetical protein